MEAAAASSILVPAKSETVSLLCIPVCAGQGKGVDNLSSNPVRIVKNFGSFAADVAEAE